MATLRLAADIATLPVATWLPLPRSASMVSGVFMELV
jgi:hypothetical protein